MGFGAFACGGLEGLESFGGDGRQTAGFNAKKKGLKAGKRQASTPRKSYWDWRWALVPLLERQEKAIGMGGR